MCIQTQGQTSFGVSLKKKEWSHNTELLSHSLQQMSQVMSWTSQTQAEMENTVKEEIFVGEKFRTFPFKPFVWNLILYSQNDEKSKIKKRQLKAYKPGERKVSMEINFALFFNYTKAMKLNSVRKFLLLQFPGKSKINAEINWAVLLSFEGQ